MTIETDAASPRQPPTPPVAPRVPSVRELHGDTATDDYAWMRDPDGPAFHDYLVVERAYYDASSRHLDGLVTRLADEAASRIPDGDEYSVSWPRGGFTYRTRMPEDGDNWQLLRSRTGNSSEDVVLDENVLAKKTGFVEVGIPRAQPRRRPARLVRGHERRRVLRPADPGPADGRGSPRGHSSHLHRRGLVGLRGVPLLSGPKRAAPPVSGVAAPDRDGG